MTAPAEVTLPITDVFSSLQGEGPAAGRPATFIRLGGCNLSCSWCTVPGTPILRPDFTWTPVEGLRVGDVVLGRTAPGNGKHGVLGPSTVTAVGHRVAPLVRVNGGLTCSADKRLWVARSVGVRSGWREVARCEGLDVTHLADPPKRDEAEYERGYLAGISDGDGCFWTLRQHGRGLRRYRLAVNDTGLLDRTREYAARAGFVLRPGTHNTTGFSGERRDMDCLWLTVGTEAERFEDWLAEDISSESWAWGYLAGIFDAEGNIGRNGGTVRIAQYAHINGRTYERIVAAAQRCGFAPVREPKAVRLSTAGGELWRFLTGATPVKRSALDTVLSRAPNRHRRVESVEHAGEGGVVSLTTSTGNYFADGWLVHNCDVPYTWDASRFDLREQIVRRPVDSILEVVDAPTVVITGGEPLLHQNSAGWRHLLAGLVKAGKQIHVETNGTIAPTPRTRAAVDLAVVSPKQEHANADLRTGLDPYQPQALEQFAGMAREGKAVLKVVVRTERNCAEAIVEADLFGWPRSAVWLMPEGTTVEDLQSRWRGVCDVAIAHGVNASHRLHVLAWGEERGH